MKEQETIKSYTSDGLEVRRAISELYSALSYVRPLVCMIANDPSESTWRAVKAQHSLLKIDAAMVAADSLQHISSTPPPTPSLPVPYSIPVDQPG